MNTVWQAAAATLAEAGCDLVVGVPSDEPGLLDAEAKGLRRVIVRDQRAGACIAAAHAIASGHPAVLALTSGPPFPNALAGLAEAASLCVPLVVVTTRIPAAGLDRGGFQETDQRSMASSLVKWHHVVESAERLEWALRRATHLSVNGRPGLTVVEVCDEAARESHRPASAPHASARPDAAAARPPVGRLRTLPARADLERAAALLRRAQRPLIILGGGAKAAGAGPAALRLAGRLGASVMVTAAGRGTVPEGHPAVLGLVGLYTSPPLEKLLAEADLVLAAGSRLEETVRMGWPEHATVPLIHLDADPHTFGQVVEPEVALLGDAAGTLEQLEHLLDEDGAGPDPHTSAARAAWIRRRTTLDEAAHAWRPDGGGFSLAREAVRAVGEVFGEHANYVHENGLHDIWSYHYPLLPIGADTRVVVPGEQTMLGFGLPAAVGAGLARPAAPTVLLCGDGALAMNIPVLATAAEYGVGLVVVVFDNSGFGWPRCLREMDGADAALTRFRVPFPFDEVVRALSGTVAEAKDAEQLRAALRAAAAAAAEGVTALVRVPVSDDDVPPGIARVLDESPDA